ncbi:MAG: hypothetical protein ACK4PI_07505 [Tepidisphaerales bacterium]
MRRRETLAGTSGLRGSLPAAGRAARHHELSRWQKLAVAAVLAAPSWTLAQATYSWVMSAPQSARNWSEGWNVDPPGSPAYPQTPGAVVSFLSLNAGLGNSSLTLDVPDAVVGSLTVGRQLGTGTFLLQSLAPDNTNALTFSNPLTGVGRLSTFNDSIGTTNVTAPVVLASDIQRFEVNNNGYAGFQLSGVLTASHPAAVLHVRHSNGANSNGPGNFNIQQPVGFAGIHISPTVTWASVGTLAVDAPLTLRNGNVSSSVNSNIRGTFIRTNFTGSAPLAIDNVGPLAHVQVTGSGSYSGTVTVTGGTFTLNHNSINVGGNNAAKVAPTAAVRLNAATFGVIGSGSAATSASVDSVALLSGQNTLSVARNGSQNASLAIGTLTRNPQATLYLVRNNTAATASVTTFGSGISPANGLLGPWAVTSNASVNNGQWDFISNSASLAPATYVSFPTGSGTGVENVTMGNNVTTAGASINSLRVTANATLTLNGNLTLSSGGILLAAPNFGSANLTIAGAGSLASGSGEFYVHQPPTPQGTFPSLTVNAPLNLGAGTLVKTGGGLMSVSNLVTAPGARLVVQGGTYRGALPADMAVSLSGGGSLDTNGATVLNVVLGSGPGEVQWGAGGGGFSASGAPATVVINGGVTLTAASLNRHLTLQTSSSNQPLTLSNPLDISGDMSITVGAFGGNAANGRSTIRLPGGLSGDGSLVVSGSPNAMLMLSSNSTFTGGVLLAGGQVWANDGEGLKRETPVQLGFGGIWATRGVMDRRLGTDLGGVDGGVRWLNEGNIAGDPPNLGHGGFAAVGGPLTVDLRDRSGNRALFAPFVGGLSSGSPASLHLGSPFSTSAVTVLNNFSTAGGTVDIRSFGPVTNVIAGNISGPNTVTIAGGNGSLLLTGDNTNHTGNLQFVGNAGVVLKFATPESAIGTRSAPGTLTIANNTTFDPNGVSLTTSTPGTFRNVSFSNGSGVGGLGMLINSGSTAVTLGDANIAAPANLNFGGPGEIRVVGNVLGGNALVKRGYGRLVLAGGNTQTNTGMLLGGGSVVFDYTTNSAPKFNGAVPANANNAAGNLQLVAVDLTLLGGSGNVTQPIPGLQLGQSSGNQLAQASPSTLNVIAGNGDLSVPITRLVRNDGQGAIDFSLSSTGTGTPSVSIGAIPLNGVVTTLTLTSGGSGYTSAPTVSFPGLDALTIAPQAVAVIDEATGTVTGLILTKQGTALDPSVPLTVNISGGGGSGATATATVAALPTIGNFATLNKRHFAALSGGTTGTLVVPTYSTPAAGIGNPLANVDVPAGVTDVTIPSVGTVTNSLRFADGSADTVLNLDGGFLRLNPHAGGILVTPDVGTRNVTINGNIRWNFNRELFVYNHSQGTLTLNGALNDVFSGAGLTKVGVGDVVLTGSLTADSLRVAGGRLILASHATLPLTSIVLGGGTPELSGVDASGRPVAPTLRYAGAGGTYGGTMTLIGPAVLDLAGTGLLDFTSTNPNLTAVNDAPWDFTITGTSDLRFSGPVRLGSATSTVPGYGVFTHASTGTTTLAGAGNRAFGGWVVQSGTLVLAHPTDTLQDDNPVTVAGGTLSVTGGDRFASLTLLSGTVAGPGFYNAGYYDLRSGLVSAALVGSEADLDKSGPGTVTLTGIAHTGGYVNVRGGTLVVAGLVNTMRPMSVTGGSSVVLGPSGGIMVGGYTQDGGSLDLSSQLFAQGNMNLLGGGTLTLNVLSDTSFGRIFAGGTVEIVNFNLDLTGLSNLSGNTTLTLVQAGSLNGTFNLLQPLPPGFDLVYGPTSLTLTPAAPPAPANWISPNSGVWSNGLNWSTGNAPNGIGAAAVFDLNAPASVINVELDTPVTLGSLTFDADTGYSVYGSSTLTLQNTVGNAQLVASRGFHMVNVPVVAQSSLTANVVSGAALVLGRVSGPGAFNRIGDGFMIVGDDLTIGGPITISGGLTIFDGLVTTSGSAVTIAAGASAEFSAAPNLPGNDPRVIVNVGPMSIGGTPDTPGTVFVFAYGAEDNRSAVLQNVVVVEGLSIANDGGPLGNRRYYGFFNLSNNDMIVRSNAAGHADTLASVRDMVRFWLTESAGLPGMFGLGSSMAFYGSNGFTTLAVFNNDPLGNGVPALSTFDGVTVSAYDVLVKYTYIGDTNLDGIVDASDLARALQGFNGGGTGWNFGDVNYDGVVDFTDLGRILAALRGQGGSLGDSSLPPVSPGPIPEPAGLAVLALGWPMLRRRRG